MDTLRAVGGAISFGLMGALMLTANGLHAQASDEKKPVVSDKPLTAEQLAIYRTVLKQYLSGEHGTLNLSIRTVPVETESPFAGHDCSKTLDMEPIQPNIVHSFKPDDLTRLDISSLRLVDPDQQGREVKKNDPGKKIRQGVSVDDTVKNGFAHALFSLSEIWFDKKHERAVVSYSFWCGSLCGNGGTLVIAKKGDQWSVKTRCGGWIS